MILVNHQHLYYFWMTVREGSITKAAHKLYLAQSTLSGQIILLEKFLGFRLLDRHKNRLLLTDEGKIVFEHANEIFTTTQEMLSALKVVGHSSPSRISIGIDNNISKQVAEKVLLAIFEFHPDIQINAISGERESLLNQLRMYSLDLLITDEERTKESDAYISQQIGTFQMFFAAAPDIASKIHDFPKDISKVRLLVPSASSPIAASIDNFFNRHHVKHFNRSTIQDLELLRMMALRGKGVAPLHEINASQELKEKKLVLIGRPLGKVIKTIWIFARIRRKQHPVVLHLIKNFRLR